jgi:hypothetical protein
MNSLRVRLMLSAAALGATVVGCGPSRPPSVPQGAVPISFSSDGGWAFCWLDTTAALNRCRTYSPDGRRLYRFRHENDDDDVFLRYQGSGPVPEDELNIDVVHSSRDFIWLKNGVVLIPRNDLEHQKQFIDELMRARAKGSSKLQVPNSRIAGLGIWDLDL